METSIKIEEKRYVDDYFPAIFCNANKTVVIIADERTSEKTFSGMIVHAESAAKKTALGTYSTGWTYEQFKRLPKGSVLTLNITQENG